MAENEQQRNGSVELVEIPPGWEIHSYTIKRLSDGALQTIPHRPTNNTPASAVPIVASSSNLPLHQDHQSSRAGTITDSLPSNHLHNLPIRQKPGVVNSNVQGLSVKTQERYANSRGDGYTIACGVGSPEIAPPVRKVNHGGGKYRCPRCMSNFTREKTVKDHFPDCISKHGNPDSLSFTDHPSMEKAKARIQRLNQTSGKASDSEEVGEDEEMYDAEMNDPRSGSSTPTSPHIKTEFVYGANIALNSIERGTSIERGCTPSWQTRSRDMTPSSSPTPNPWLLFEYQTPRPTSGDGLQDDGLDPFMDRRSIIARTPTVCPSPKNDDRTSTACPSPNHDDYLQEDVKMEEEASV